MTYCSSFFALFRDHILTRFHGLKQRRKLRAKLSLAGFFGINGQKYRKNMSRAAAFVLHKGEEWNQVCE